MNQGLDNISMQKLREKYIRDLSESNDSTERAKELSDNLFSLDLTVYSKNFTFDSIIYSSFATSLLDNDLILHPEQIEILQAIENNQAVIVSAPTSFGKTFCVFEYIAKHKPRNIVLIVPTLALVDEYLKKIIKKYHYFFKIYKVHTQIDSDKNYNFQESNIFVLTHDKVVQENAYNVFKEIDFLAIDEVYKLETDIRNDRVLVLNMAYYQLSKIASKYVLLAPFISAIENIEDLEKRPLFFNTDYSPVVNEVKEINILRNEDRHSQCSKILNKISKEEKTLIYFPSVTGIFSYVNKFLCKEKLLEDIPNNIKSFLEWAKDEIHEEWCVVKALERGYVIHNGQMPLGTRIFQLNLYENNPNYNRLLCTSTLLEGVNTVAKNIVITQPARTTTRNNTGDNFSAFDFYNLVGRTGRLNQHFIGTAYYLKGPNDPHYKKIDAIKSIKFEIIDKSKDIDIQMGDIENHPDFKKFINELGITLEAYLDNIGRHTRFDTVLAIFNRYKQEKSNLFKEFNCFLEDNTHGRNHLISILYFLCEGENNKFISTLLNNLINRNRPKLKTVVNNTKAHNKKMAIDFIISNAVRLKMSYIEHTFYNRVNIVKYFMETQKVSTDYLEILQDKVLGAIEQLYFTNSKQRKMLMDLGVYESDIAKIIKVIGEDFEDTLSMKKALTENYNKMKNISYISKFIIESL